MSEDIRWKQRFENFGKALSMLRDMINMYNKEPGNHAYEIAVIGAFHFTFELGWKTLKDYLNYGGIEAVLPRDVIKKAFNNQLISDGQTWIDMLEDRNMMAHSYDQAKALAATNNIKTLYIEAIEQLYSLLQQKLDE